MDIEAEIEKAIQIGQRNKEVIELAQNWCAHAEVGQTGGIGLVEIQTGLPTGMRFFKCKYARAQGMARMLLDEIAVDFYDRNCVDCKQRAPVRLPNLSEGSGPARADIFAAIEAFDRQPNEEHRRILLGMAGAVPEQFDCELQEALHDVAEAGGSTRTEGALEVLDLVATDRSRLSCAALRAFGRRDGHAAAASLVEKHLGKEHESDVPAAMPTILALASPVEGIFPGSGSSGDPRALVRAYRLFPEVVTNAIKEQLRSPREYLRIQACDAISLLLAIDASFLVQFGRRNKAYLSELKQLKAFAATNLAEVR